MYDFMIRKCADLFAGTSPADVVLRPGLRPYFSVEQQFLAEYLRGQVELIIEMGIAPYSTDVYDSDHIKALVARDVRKIVRDNDTSSRPSIPVR